MTPAGDPATQRSGTGKAINRCTRIGIAAVAVVAMLAGCSSPTPSPAAPAGGTLTVFAAASLQKAFTEIGEQFTTDNPGSDVEFSFAGSADLVTQLTQGAPADVLATADTTNMGKAATAGLLAGTPANFATNTLTIVVAPGNPKKIGTFRDLAAPELSVVVCAPQVPCGSATKKVEQATGVTLNPVSEESQVTDVLGKVLTGQADAGVVYVTDAQISGDKVTTVAFPEAARAANTYPIGILGQATDPELARKFVDLVTGEAGRKVLRTAGFGPP
jgi:molybdate transport system substrate-binding protein